MYAASPPAVVAAAAAAAVAAAAAAAASNLISIGGVGGYANEECGGSDAAVSGEVEDVGCSVVGYEDDLGENGAPAAVAAAAALPHTDAAVE